MAEFSLPREISRLSRRRIMFTRIKISRWLARIPGLDILSHGTFSIVLPPLIASVARSTELPPTHTRVMDERRPPIDQKSRRIVARKYRSTSMDKYLSTGRDRVSISERSISDSLFTWNQTCTNSYTKVLPIGRGRYCDDKVVKSFFLLFRRKILRYCGRLWSGTGITRKFLSFRSFEYVC